MRMTFGLSALAICVASASRLLAQDATTPLLTTSQRERLNSALTAKIDVTQNLGNAPVRLPFLDIALMALSGTDLIFVNHDEAEMTIVVVADGEASPTTYKTIGGNVSRTERLYSGCRLTGTISVRIGSDVIVSVPFETIVPPLPKTSHTGIPTFELDGSGNEAVGPKPGDAQWTRAIRTSFLPVLVELVNSIYGPHRLIRTLEVTGTGYKDMTGPHRAMWRAIGRVLSQERSADATIVRRLLDILAREETHTDLLRSLAGLLAEWKECRAVTPLRALMGRHNEIDRTVFADAIGKIEPECAGGG